MVKFGMEADPRSRAKVNTALARAKREYNGLKGEKKKDFDTEKLKNPYADTRILYGDASRNISTVMVGVDVGGEELLLCDRLNQMGRSIDLAMSHHPHGPALARLSEVMNIHSDLLSELGVSLDVAKELTAERIRETERSFQSRNFSRYIEVARLLDIPYICCHTVADNHVATFLQRLLDKAKPKKLKDVLNVLGKVPEYRQATRSGAGPKIIIGKSDAPAGKIFVDMTGGTEGSKRAFARISQAGIKTLVCMHLSEAHLQVARKEYINIIIAGHIASDNIGTNLLLDKLLKVEDLEIIECSGFKRVKR